MKEPISKRKKHFCGFGDFRLYVAERELFRGAEPVALPPKALDTLLVLVSHRGHVVDKDELMKALWPDTFVEEGNLLYQISQLRKALGERPDGGPYIETIARRGYRFVAPVADSWEEPTGSGLAVASPSGQEAKSVGRRVALLATSVGLVLILGGVWLRFFRPTARPTEADLKIVPLTSYPGSETWPSFSPDGSQVTFAWRREDSDDYDIYVKAVGSGESLQLTSGRDSDVAPAWSPDGQRIAFYRQSESGAGIYEVSPFGGSERLLADLISGPFGWGPVAAYPPPLLSWSPDGKLLAFQDAPAEPYSIYLLSIETGEKRRLTSPPATWLGDVSPAISPDGQTVAFVRVQMVGRYDIYLVPSAGGDPERLTFDGRWIGGLTWTPDGREVVFRSQEWMWRVSASGGEPARLAGLGGNALLPAISRGGQRLVFARHARDRNIWRVEAPDPEGVSKPATKLIASTRWDTTPEYSPGGKRIAFTSDRSGTRQVWLCDSDGSNPVQLTSFSGPGAELSSWSPDGQYIAFNSSLKGNWDIYVISARGGAARQLTTHSAVDARPSWSRDGRWIYFASNRTGAFQVWKVPAEGGTPVQVTKNGGYRALESADGRFIYYTKDQVVHDAWRVPVEGGEEVPVLGDLQSRWSLVEKGLYFYGREEGAATEAQWFIKFFDLQTGEVGPIVALDKEPVTGAPPAVSRDSRSFLCTQEDVGEADLMLVENFR